MKKKKQHQQKTEDSSQAYLAEESISEDLLDQDGNAAENGLSPSDIAEDAETPETDGTDFTSPGSTDANEADYDKTHEAETGSSNIDGTETETETDSLDFDWIDGAEDDSSAGKAKKKKSRKAKKEKNSRKKRKPLLIAAKITIAAAIVIICGTMLYYHIYYSNRWYKNTYVNDVDVSGQTLEQSKKTVLSKLKGYGLTVNGRDGGKLTINGDDIDYEFKINQKYDELFAEEHKSPHLFSKKSELSINYDVTYDEKKLNKLIKKSDMVTGSNDYKITRPKSASVKYSSEKLQYECVKERMGNVIIKSALTEGIKDALSKAETTLDINDLAENPSEHVLKNVYKAPRVTSDSPELQKRLKASNSKALRFVAWNMGKGVTEQITPTEISSWIDYKNGKIKYDWDAVSEWVEDFCKKYKTVGKNRKVKMHNGKTVTVKGGDYGWQIDFDKTLKQAKKALQADIDQEKIDAYIEDPSEENRAALTSKRKVQYSNTAYRKDFENFSDDWDPKNYTEISLSKQKVYVIRNGKVKFSCKTISGRPTPERATKKGAYFIKEHNRSRILRGDDYATPVKNWVRITWSGTGFHSATWQPWSRWTKDLYKTRGSHGCLNLSMADSLQIYKLTQYREAVFIY